MRVARELVLRTTELSPPDRVALAAVRSAPLIAVAVRCAVSLAPAALFALRVTRDAASVTVQTAAPAELVALCAGELGGAVCPLGEVSEEG
jgi:hypothetical protein